MAKDLLISCPRCGQTNFTARGLRAHRCPRKEHTPLTQSEWQAAMGITNGGRTNCDFFPNRFAEKTGGES